MAIARAQVTLVACNIPGCEVMAQFVMPCDLQATGWLEVMRLGDLPTRKRAFICPDHAKEIGLAGDDFAESVEAEPVKQGFNRLSSVPFPGQLFPEVPPQLANLLTGGRAKQIAEKKKNDD